MDQPTSDTLAKVRPHQKGNRQLYEVDYEDLSVLEVLSELVEPSDLPAPTDTSTLRLEVTAFAVDTAKTRQSQVTFWIIGISGGARRTRARLSARPSVQCTIHLVAPSTRSLEQRTHFAASWRQILTRPLHFPQAPSASSVSCVSQIVPSSPFL